MELYIGGTAQGKYEYVKKKHPDGQIINRYHLIIRKLVQEGEDPLNYTMKLMEDHPDALIISDEVGLGIVPADPFEREYREKVGRCLCLIAKEAEHVERVICGMGQVIK